MLTNDAIKIATRTFQRDYGEQRCFASFALVKYVTLLFNRKKTKLPVPHQIFYVNIFCVIAVWPNWRLMNAGFTFAYNDTYALDFSIHFYAVGGEIIFGLIEINTYLNNHLNTVVIHTQHTYRSKGNQCACSFYFPSVGEPWINTTRYEWIREREKVLVHFIECVGGFTYRQPSSSTI